MLRTVARRRLLFSTCLTGAALGTAGAAHAQDSSSAIWQSRASLYAQAGSEENEVGAELFAPLAQDDNTLLFATGRLGYNDRFNENGSAILGLRRRIGEDFALGINAGIDAYQSEFGSRSQTSASLGLEAFTGIFDVRLNYRLPLSGNREIAFVDPTTTGPGALVVDNNRLVERRAGFRIDEIPLSGFNGEAGVRIPLSDRLSVRAFGGGFRYTDDAADDDYKGFRGGLEVEFFDSRRDGIRMTVGAEVQDDNRFGTQGRGMVRVSIPLGRRNTERRALSAIERQMGDRVRRDYAAPSGTHLTTLTADSFAIDARTGRAFGGVYFVDGGAAGAGTQADPTTLNDAVTRAGQNGVVVAFGNAGIITTAGVTLAADQYLVGGGTGSVDVRLTNGSVTALTFGGTNGIISGTNAAGAAVTLGQGSVVRDITIRGAGSGILASGVGGFSLDRVIIENTGGVGLSLLNTTGNIVIDGLTVRGAGGTGLLVSGGSNVTIRNSTLGGGAGALAINDGGTALAVSLTNLNLSATGGTVLSLDGSGAGTVTVAGLGGITITGGNGETGGLSARSVAFDGSLTTAGLQALNAGRVEVGTAAARVNGTGVSLSDVTGTLTFADLDIANNAGTGLLVQNSKANNFLLSSTDGSVNTVGGTALNLDPLLLNLVFASVSSSGASGPGIVLNDVQGAGPNGRALQIGTLTITNSGQQGLLITGGSTGNVVIGAGSISGSGGAAVQIGQQGVAGSGGTIGLTFGAAITETGSGPAIAIYQAGGILAFTGPITGSGGIVVDGTLAGSSVTIAGPSLTGTTGAAISLNNVAGTLAFTGTTRIANPIGDGIVIGSVPGGVTFGDVDITGLGAGTGLDLTATQGNVTFVTLDITGTGAPGSIGIDLRGATNAGSVIIGAPSIIQGVDIGVDLTNAAISGTFRYGDGNAGNGLQSTISANVPLVITGLNGSQGNYNFADANLVGDISNLTGNGFTTYYVAAGANGAGTASDPGSLLGAEASGADYIVLLNDPTGGRDVIDAASAGGSLDLEAGQTLLSFLNSDFYAIAGASLPANLVVSGIGPSGITNPFAGSGASILTTTTAGSATVTLADDTTLDGLVIQNGGTGVGVLGSGTANVTIANSDISGATGAISLTDGGQAASAMLNDLELSSAAGTVLSLSGTGPGTLTVSGSGIDVSATGTASALNVDTVTAGGLAFGTIEAGVSGGTAVQLNAVSGGPVTATSISVDGITSGAGISVSNSSATINLGNVTVGSAAGDGISLTGISGAVTAGTVSVTGTTGAGVRIEGVTGSVSLGATTIGGGSGAGIALADIDGAVSFTGTTTITNPGTTGIVLGGGSAGSIAFGNVDITALAANTTGVDARNASGTVTFATLDITGASATGTRGIDLNGATFAGSVTTLDSGTITGVGIGVDLTNANISGTFRYGDGSNTDADGAASTINATVPIVITGLNAAQGNYNFADVNLIGDTSALSTVSTVYYVLAGANGTGTQSDPGSLAGAEASGADYIVLLNNPDGGQDTLDADAAGGSLNLATDQNLLSFLNQDSFTLTGSAPANVVLFGFTSGVGNPFAGSGAPILTATGPGGAATVVLGGNNLIDGVVVRNDRRGVGISGSSLTGTTIIRNSQVSGAAGAIDIRDGNAASSLLLENLTLSSRGGNILNLIGTGTGSLTIRALSDLTLLGGNGETGGIVANDVTFDGNALVAGNQGVEGGITRIGTAAARVGGAGLSLTDVDGALGFVDLDIATNGGTALLVDNSAGNAFTLVTLAGSIDAANGIGVRLTSTTLRVSLDAITAANGAYGAFFSGTSGTFDVVGPTTITNPGTAGIVLGVGTTGTIAFGDVDITGLGANTTGLDARNAGGTVTFNTLDITGTSATGTRGIDLRGATFAGSVTTLDSGTITGVGIGVDLTNAAITGTFQYGDGSNTDADGAASTINATVPIVIAGLNAAQGIYNFADVNLIGDTGNLSTSASVYYVLAGASGAGTRSDPGSLTGAEASGADYIILLNNPLGGQDTLDANSAGGSLNLATDQNLLSFLNQDFFGLPGGAPPNVILFGVIAGVSNPFAGSGAPVLTTTAGGGTSTVILSGNNLLDGLIIRNGGSGAGIFGTDLTGTTTIQNSQIFGAARAIDIRDGATNAALIFRNLTLGASGNFILNLVGTGAGSLTVRDMSGLTILGGNGETGGIIVNDVTFDSDAATAGNQTVNAGAITIGTNAARVGGRGLSLTNVDGGLSFTDLDIATNGDSLVIFNTAANTFSLATAAGTINALNGSGVQIFSTAVAMTLNDVTVANGFDGVRLASATSGSFAITGTLSATDVIGAGLGLGSMTGTVNVATLVVSNPTQGGGGISIFSNSAGNLDVDIGGGSILTSASSPITVSNTGTGTVDLSITLATASTTGELTTGPGLSFANTGTGALTGAVTVAGGSVAAFNDALVVNGGSLNITYGGSLTGVFDHSINISNTSGDILLSGAIIGHRDGVLITNLLAGGSVSLTGSFTADGATGIVATDIAAGASISFNNVTISNLTVLGGIGIELTNIDGSATFTGTTTITNPFKTGIVLGAGSSGTITFGNTDITGLAANTTGVDARNASGTVVFNTLDITGASATGTRGIDLRGATFAGSVTTTDSGTITGVGIGVDLTNAAITGLFRYGDGSNTDADGAASTINATTPIVIAGLNSAQGIYNFADVKLIGDTSQLSTSASVYYVLAGASGAGTRNDPGSLTGAEAAAADYIVLLNNPTGGQDTLDAASAGGSFNLDAGQTLLSFLNQDNFALPGGAPANVVLFGITQGADNPFAGSGAPILTTTTAATSTVILTGNNLLDGLIIRNGGAGAGISGSGLTGTITIRNSQVSGGAGAINISDGATAASLVFQNLALSASGGNILNLLGTGAGSLTIRTLSGLTLTGGNGETGGIVINDATFDSDAATGGNQTVNAGAITIGTNAARVGGAGLSLTNVNGGLSFADLDVSTNNGTGVLLVNSGANTFTLGTSAGTIDTTNGSGVVLNGSTLAMTLNSVTATSGASGVLLAGTSGSFAVTGTLSATNMSTAGLAIQDGAGTINIATLTVSNPAAAGFGILVNQTTATSFDLDVGAGSISTSSNGPISVVNSAGGTVDLGVTLATVSSSAPVGRGMRFENTAAGALTGSVTVTGGAITSTTDGLFVNGGALNVTYGGTINATAGNSVDVSGTSGDIVVSGAITDGGAGVLVNNLLAGGSVSLTGSSTFTGSQGITATNIATGASVSFNAVTTTNTSGVAITLSNIDGSATFTGTTTITNPTTAGIVLGTGTSGTITFGNTDITGLAANTTGLDARNAAGTVVFNTLDITGASATGTRGIDLRGATFAGSVTTTDSGTITGVGIGVDLTNANISGTFQYGDGSNTDADGAASTINATTPIVIAGLNAAQGTYNFADVNLIGDTSNLSTSATVFYVLEGATGVGTRSDPGSLTAAEAATADYIILLNNPAGGQDTLDATSAGGSFNLDAGQSLISFLNQDNFALPGGAPANVVLFGITQGASNPFAGSGAPILTTTTAATSTVVLTGNNLLDGLIIRNGGAGAGISGSGLTGTITIRNSQVSGGAGAINISDGATAASLVFQNLALSASGGNILNLLGTGAGSLTVRTLSGLTLTGGNGETGGIVINDATFDSDAATGGNQTVAAGAITIGTNAARVGGAGLSLTNVNGGLSFADLDVSTNNGTGVLLTNSGANTFTLGTSAGTIDTTNGSGVLLNGSTLAMTLNSVTATSGTNGVFLSGNGGSFSVGTLSATNMSTAGLAVQDENATVTVTTLTVSNPVAAGFGVIVNQTTAGTLDLNIAGGTISTSGNAPISVVNSAGGTVDLDIVLTSTSTSAPVGRGLRFENSGAGTLTGSVNAGTGAITSTTDGLFVSGGALNVTYAGTINATAGNSVDVSGTSGDIVVSGAITDGGAGVLVNNLLAGGSVSLTGSSTFTGSQGITATNIATGASVSFNAVTTTNTSGVAITLSNIDGSATFTGTTTITNPTTAGIVLGTGTSGTITFGNTDITGLAANTTGLDARNAAGTVVFNTLDITGASATGTRGIDLTGATFAGSVKTTDSGTITGVAIGVDLTNANISGTFQYGDGSNTDADGAASTINATTPIVIAGLNGAQGIYDFDDVNLIGDTSNLSVSAYYVREGATGIGTRSDPGSLAGAEAASAQYIVLLNDPTGGQDTLDANSAGGSFDLDNNQNLLSFKNTDTFNVGGGAPANILLFGITGGVITNPFAGSGAPILTTTAAAAPTLVLGGTNIVDGVVIRNGGATGGVGILGANIVNITLRNSDIQGRTGGIDLADGAANSRVALSNLLLSSLGGIVLSVDGLPAPDGAGGAGTLFVTDFSNITILGNLGETGGAVFGGVVFDADPSTAAFDQVNGGAFVAGTTANRVGGFGLALAGNSGGAGVSGSLDFTSVNIAVRRTNNGVFGASAIGIYGEIGGTGTRVNFGTGTINVDGGAGAGQFFNAVSLLISTGDSAGFSGNLSATGTNGAGGLRARNLVGNGTLFLGGTDNDFSAAGTGSQSLVLISLGVQNGSGGSAVIDTVSSTGGNGALQLSNLTMPAPLTFTGAVTVTGAAANTNAISMLNPGTVQFNGAVTITNAANGVSLTTSTAAANSVTFANGLSIGTTGGFGLSANVIAGSLALNILGTSNSINAAGSGGGLLLSGVALSNGSGGAASFSSINFNGASGTGIAVTNTTGTLNVGSAVLNAAGGNGITISNSASFTANFLTGGVDIDTGFGTGISVSGGGNLTIAGSGNTVNTTGGSGVVVTGGAGTIAVNANVTAGSPGLAASVTGRTGGSVTLSGALSGSSITVSTNTGGTASFGNLALTGDVNFNDNSGGFAATFAGSSETIGGVRMNNNTGARIDFTNGGLVIGGDGIRAENGGTLTVTGSGNTITTSVVAALFMENTDVGAAGLTFQSISVLGIANSFPQVTKGVQLFNTGSGSITVTGTGTPGSGGTIQNLMNAGIWLVNTGNASFSWMNIDNVGAEGITYNASGGNQRTFVFTNNVFSNINFQLDLVTGAFGAGTVLNTRITGNTADPGDAYLIQSDGGAIITVTQPDLATLSSTNDGVQIFGSGITFNGPSP